jgi:hypothetical protein
VQLSAQFGGPELHPAHGRGSRFVGDVLEEGLGLVPVVGLVPPDEGGGSVELTVQPPQPAAEAPMEPGGGGMMAQAAP